MLIAVIVSGGLAYLCVLFAKRKETALWRTTTAFAFMPVCFAFQVVSIPTAYYLLVGPQDGAADDGRWIMSALGPVVLSPLTLILAVVIFCASCPPKHDQTTEALK